MASSYLDRPLLPLAVVLPQQLKNIEAQLANEQLDPAQKSHLRQCADLIHRLLAPRHSR